MNWYKKSQQNNIIFFKFDQYDNSKSKRQLPYDGIHAWAVPEEYLNKVLEILNVDISDVEIINPSFNDIIYAIDYKNADYYITLPSYEEWLEEYGPYENMSEEETREYYNEEIKKELPKLEIFNPSKHCIEIINKPYNSDGWGGNETYQDISNPYQVLIKDNNELV